MAPGNCCNFANAHKSPAVTGPRPPPTCMSFLVLPAGAPDVAPLLAMIRALADYERLGHQVVATEAALTRWLFGDRPAAEALIAWESVQKQEALGFAVFFPTFSTFLASPGLWLEDLFVYPGHRGRGIGRRLLSEVAAIARARGCTRLGWSVLDWNQPAIRFYEGMGATLLPDWRMARVAGSALATFGVPDPAGDAP